MPIDQHRTICAKCKKVLQIEPRPIWYNFYCRAVKKPAHQNHVTGEWEGDEYAYCKDVNTNGNCELYEAK